jgi:hypothetical protein
LSTALVRESNILKELPTCDKVTVDCSPPNPRLKDLMPRTIELTGEVSGKFQGYTRGVSEKLTLHGHIEYSFDEHFTTLSVKVPHFNGVEGHDVLQLLKDGGIINSTRVWKEKSRRDSSTDDEEASSLDIYEHEPYTAIKFKRRVRRP